MPDVPMKLCVACKGHHPFDHFDKASPEFPTRDGYQYNCRESVKDSPVFFYRAENGKVEMGYKSDLKESNA